MEYSKKFTDALDMIDQLSKYPLLVEQIEKSPAFVDFTVLLAMHIEDMES